MNPKLIKVESKNLLDPIYEVKNGFVVNNKLHKKQNLIYIGNNILEISKRIKNGWQLMPGEKNWILRAPEYALVDLSELQANPTENLIEILTLYRIVKKTKIEQIIEDALRREKINNLEVILLRGRSLEAELRIAGSDQRAKKLPFLICSHLKKEDIWKKEFKKIQTLLKPRKINIYEKKLSDCSSKTKSFAQKIIKHFSLLGQNINTNAVIGGFWQFLRLPTDYQIIFILKSSFKYALGYLEDTKADKNKIILWEYHSGQDTGKEVILASSDIKNKRAVIIDRSYSGGTLHQLAKKVRNLGGYPIKLSLFPKSTSAVKNSDIVLFLDIFLDKKQISLGKDWAEKLFISVVNRKI